MMRTIPRLVPKPAWPAVALCLAVNLFVFAAIASRNAEYLRDYRRNEKSDARHYVLLGRNYLLKGEYSRCNGPPYAPDVFRTPVYPLFAGAADHLGNAAAIYLAQALLQVGSCLVLFHLVRPHFGESAAMWAGLLMASDLTIGISNFEAMSEPLYLFLNLAGVACLVPVVFQPRERRLMLGRLVAGGALLAAATLTRPVGLYVPLIFAAVLMSAGAVRRQMGRAAAQCLVLMAVVALPVGGWIVRNSLMFSVNRLTTADAIMLVYVTGAGAYQVEHDITLEEAQAIIGREHDLPPPV
ncbi:MAG: glycosyltransferase family 39 protein, partial [Planctomycetaceae bacterium]